jgi:ABC-2 type transport system ATP-binding protein
MENAIQVNKLSRHFGNFKAVDQISFQVGKGEIFGFLGANGAGKTTAIRMLTGLLKPTSGEAQVAGYNVNQQPDLVKQNIGYMSQKFSLYDDLTVYENMRLYGGIYGMNRKAIKAKAEQELKNLQLWDSRNALVKSLPLGWKQKLAFVVASFHDPAIVFLDEPTSGVDPITRRQFWNMIYEAAHNGTTIFITTHYMEEAEYCHRISIMVSGKIEVLDTPKEIKNQLQAKSMYDVFLKLTR